MKRTQNSSEQNEVGSKKIKIELIQEQKLEISEKPTDTIYITGNTLPERNLSKLCSSFGNIKNFFLDESKTQSYVQYVLIEHAIEAQKSTSKEQKNLKVQFVDYNHIKEYFEKKEREEQDKKARLYLQRVFPPIDNPSPLFEYDNDGLTYITPHWFAKKTSKWFLSRYYTISGTYPKTIIDGTCGLGGDVISFGLNQNITKVIGCELNEKRFQCLKHNVMDVYKLQKKVELYNTDFMTWYEKQDSQFLRTAVVYLDPPWGGISYKELTTIPNLYLNQQNNEVTERSKFGMEELCEKLLKKSPNVVLKLPFNFDMRIFSKLNYQVQKTKKIIFASFLADWFR